MVNLSGIKYDYALFSNKVLEFEWIDHQAPQLVTLFLICEEIYLFLSADIDNIVVINCKAGKGRTGTVLCCFLLYSGVFDHPADALAYYAKKRFQQTNFRKFLSQNCQNPSNLYAISLCR